MRAGASSMRSAVLPPERQKVMEPGRTTFLMMESPIMRISGA